MLADIGQQRPFTMILPPQLRFRQGAENMLSQKKSDIFIEPILVEEVGYPVLFVLISPIWLSRTYHF